MPLPRLAIVLIALIILGEGAVAVWRHLPVEPSTAPVFSFPPAAANFDTPGKLDYAIQLYGADRGAEWRSTAADGSRLTIFYFEWDRVEVGPFMSITDHSTDICNVAAGFHLQQILPERDYHVSGRPPLVFDCTHFTDTAGRDIFMFKMPWLQGIGSLPMRESYNRQIRLTRTLTRHAGTARVLQAGVFDARDADHAWQIFRSEVLDQLEW